MNDDYLDISIPDPGWDYYEIWMSLSHVKNLIDGTLRFMAEQEQADKETDEKLKEMLEPALVKLEAVVENDLTDYSDENLHGDY